MKMNRSELNWQIITAVGLGFSIPLAVVFALPDVWVALHASVGYVGIISILIGASGTLWFLNLEYHLWDKLIKELSKPRYVVRTAPEVFRWTYDYSANSIAAQVERDKWRLTVDQMFFMMDRHNTILDAYQRDDMEALRKIEASDEYRKRFGQMSFDEAFDRYESAFVGDE